jgi:hypothetical protein
MAEYAATKGTPVIAASSAERFLGRRGSGLPGDGDVFGVCPMARETNVSLDGATFVLREFWPDINNAFFHQKD